MLPINTGDIVENIARLSLWNSQYNVIPTNQQLAIYQDICNQINMFEQIEGKNLNYNYTVNYYTGVTGANGYSIIDTTNGGTTTGNWTATSVTFQWSTASMPLSMVSTSAFMNQISVTNINAYPSCWTWYVPLQQIWVYPPPCVPGTFVVLGKPLFPQITVVGTSAPFTFNPSTFSFATELNYINYMTYYVAKQVCLINNAAWTQEKEAALQSMRASLIQNKVPDLTQNALPPLLTAGKLQKSNPFPWFYYLSGGPR